MCAGSQQVVFEGYALVRLTVAMRIVSGLLSGFTVDADALAKAEQGFNLLVLTLESSGLDFGHNNRRQQENGLRFQQLDKTSHGLWLFF